MWDFSDLQIWYVTWNIIIFLLLYLHNENQFILYIKLFRKL